MDIRPKVVVISKSKKASRVMKRQLDILLGDIINFYDYSIEEGISGKIHCNLCLIPSEDLSLIVSEKLFPETKIITIKRTLLKEKLGEVTKLPYGTKALIVNTSIEFSLETIAHLLELGINYIDLYPYYPNHENYPQDIQLAITPGEKDLVPKGIDKVIDIGNRVIDGITIFEILNALNLLNDETREMLLDYIYKMLPENLGLLELIRNSDKEKEYLKAILDKMGYIIIAHDKNNQISYYNKAGKVGNTPDPYTSPLEEYLRNKVFTNFMEINNAIVEIKGTYHTVNRQIIFKDGNYNGGIIAIKKYNPLDGEIKKREINAPMHRAKYTFNDILGNSMEIKKTIERAIKAAHTELDILIEGETGTGKEIFANSIHNESNRKSGPFIAFNCSAISSNLLESELFGYEEGAFTGAKKGGKPGLMEIGNHGTLFLDEIGEISQDIQVKLLRVLQEREIIRVGGLDRIPINVRIIAATNRNLLELVKSNKFRADLYYRLNVISLRIPPLRERKGDILYFISSILKDSKLNYTIDDELLEILEDYTWPGNVRELHNYCTSIISMGDKFCKNTLPRNIIEFYEENDTRQKHHLDIIDENLNIKYEILGIIHDAMKGNNTIGRKIIARKLVEANYNTSEQQVRTILYRLAEEGLIEIYKGRKGTIITKKGEEFLKNCLL